MKNKFKDLIKKYSSNTLLTDKFWYNLENFSSYSLLEKKTSYTACLRQLGRQQLDLSSEPWLQNAPSINVTKLNLGQLGRILILLTYDNDNEFINEIFLRGDESEQIPLIQVLQLLEKPQQYTEAIINLCRSNSITLYQAISQNNPYPSLNFDDNSFFHLAIKTIFLELSFSKISGLEKRYTKTFGNILIDFYNERTSAGRTLPDDVIKFMKTKGIL